MRTAGYLHESDRKILAQLQTIESVALIAAAAISTIVFIGWLLPAAGSLLPPGWALMKANTAFAVLLCCAGMVLSERRHAVRICAVMVLILAIASILEHWGATSFPVNTLLVPEGAQAPGRMAIQSACFLVLLACSLLIARDRHDGLGHALDLLVAAQVTLMLLLVAGSIFGAVTLIGESWATRTSPQALICLGLLTLVQTARRAPHGYLSVLVGVGIGSQIARIAMPFSLMAIYLLIFAGANLLARGYLALPTAAALTAASMAALTFFFVIVATRKINDLGKTLRDLSLTDELTGLHNRRGFFLLGEQALRDARRAASPLSVLFIDADGLKVVNDVLGHHAGSALLQDIAALLRTTFRSSDVIGRLGGDEFAVVTYGPRPDLAIQRLQEATAAVNSTADKPYRIAFSIGVATSEPQDDESFGQVVELADAAMYEEKRERRSVPGLAESTLRTHIDVRSAG